MEKTINNGVIARHKALAGPPIFLAEHNLYLRTCPPAFLRKQEGGNSRI